MRYGFIGCGNMGSAIVRSLRQATGEIAVSDRSGKARKLAQELSVAYLDVPRIAQECDMIFLAVKPHMMEAVLQPLQPILRRRRPVLITMAAGLTIARIEAFAGVRLPVIRIMPNTPTAVGKGVIPFCHNDLVEAGTLEIWLNDMRRCGITDPLEERLMDAASALSGSGPAYLYMMLEAMADGAVACGLPREKAALYAAMTMAGAAEMALCTGVHPGALKDAVCSPGGSTIMGVQKLEQQSFRGAVMDCVIAAWERNQKLEKG